MPPVAGRSELVKCLLHRPKAPRQTPPPKKQSLRVFLRVSLQTNPPLPLTDRLVARRRPCETEAHFAVLGHRRTARVDDGLEPVPCSSGEFLFVSSAWPV